MKSNSDLKAAALVLVFIIAMGFQKTEITASDTVHRFQQPEALTITLKVQDWETVLEGLGELPHKKAAPVDAQIRQQAMKQLQPPVKPDSTGSKSKKQ